MYETARIHHGTVSNYQNHLFKKRRRTNKKENKMSKITVDSRVWAIALRLSGGDRSRIIVTSPTEVHVVNRSKRKG